MDKYNVYLHTRDDNNHVFYVGMGKNRRPWSLRDRHRDWKEVVSTTTYTVTVVFTTDNKQAALEKERELILHYGRLDQGTGTLVNKNNGIIGDMSYVHTSTIVDNIKECRQCHAPLIGRQKYWCSELCKKKHRYHHDDEFRIRTNKKRVERIISQRSANLSQYLL